MMENIKNNIAPIAACLLLAAALMFPSGLAEATSTAAPEKCCLDCQGLVCVQSVSGYFSCTQDTHPWSCEDGPDMCNEWNSEC